VRLILDSLAIEYIQEAKAGRYSLDFLLPNRVVIEVDGNYWHQDKAKEQRRDNWLINHGYRVIHLPENKIDNDIKWCKHQIIAATQRQVQASIYSEDAGAENQHHHQILRLVPQPSR
jgi:very-short-patch-repair endonuclease